MYQLQVFLNDDGMSSFLFNLDIMVDLGGLIIILLGFFWMLRGIFLANAVKKKDVQFIREYGSKTRPPFFFFVLGITLIVCGFIVVFVPFATEV